MDKIAVLIPCYNEAVTIGKVIADFRTVLPEATIYVYDNNSTDDTVQIASQAGAVVRRVTKQGKGNVIRAMFRDIEAEAYVMIDGDDTYPAEYAPEMVGAILSGEAEMVIGDRLSSTYFEENKRPFHNFGNVLVRQIINQMFNSDIRDIMTGYRAFSYAFVKTFSIQSTGFEIETEMTIHSLDKHLPIKNVIVTYRDRPEGSVSKLNTYKDGFRVIKTIGRLIKNYRPFRYFTAIAFVLSLISALLFLPVWIEFRQTGTVERFTTLFVSGFFFLAAMIVFIAGIILDVQCYHFQQRFEMEFKNKKSQRGLKVEA
mgnify:FL=1